MNACLVPHGRNLDVQCGKYKAGKPFASKEVIIMFVFVSRELITISLGADQGGLPELKQW